MIMTFSQFADKKHLSIQSVRRLAREGSFNHIFYKGQRYELSQHGRYDNGAPRYLIVMPDDNRKKKHLSDDQRTAALTMLYELFAKQTNAADAISNVAKRFGVSYWSIYRLWKNPERAQRKSRSDKGSTKKTIPAQAIELFDSIYIQNAGGPNALGAYKKMKRMFEGFELPFHYFKTRVAQLEPLRLAFHQEAKFEKLYTPRVRRDLWAEFEFLEQVSLDGWTVPDRVLKSWGLEDLTQKKFQFNGKDTSMVCVFAFDTKTRHPLAWRAFERSVTADDVLSVLLDVVYNWGRPSSWLLDNGSEFVNESVQRFLRGLYTTQEHDAKRRIIFSQAYQPYGKASHERQHKIFKDEFCAFSRSYSPNQKESRKPGLQLSYVKPTHTLAGWVEKFELYLNGYYREAQRVSWLNPDYRPHDPINAERPRTLNEAFERAYKTFTPHKVEPIKLAFLYAKKFRSVIKNGTFVAPAAISARKLVYIPEGEGISFDRYGETFEIIVNPMNLYQAWVCDLNNNFVCEAWDLRGKNRADVPTREVAAQYRKLRNQQKKFAKREAEARAALVNMGDIWRGKQSTQEKVEVRNIEEALYTLSHDEYFDAEAIEFADALYDNSSTISEDGQNAQHRQT